MKLHSKYYGDIEYNDSDIITFSKGLPGFKKLTKFIIVPFEGNNVFSIMHSTEDIEIGIIIVSPFMVVKDYEFKLLENQIKELEVEKESDILVYNTVCPNKDVSKMTVNLKAPIVINTKSKVGEQLILDNDKYPIKYPLLKEE
ncbi:MULTISPECIES: flagellar assembly protein FliW [Clostridium]|uniref:flagellar assembly protein FliW n=1 Tax=Clostridium TaxID=1485 RepID=UPI00082582E3|nr:MULTISPECIES: flagellar assembly protein FliW [Clostridium]PJI09823.1 flagellar assembly protein FliW [Clostridium sp. CT7]